MNSPYRSGHASIILAAVTSMVTVIVFVCFLLVAASARGDSIVKTLVRPAVAPAAFASGTVVAEQNGDTQRFAVQVVNVPLPAEGLGVFLGDTPVATNGAVFVNVLSKGAGTNDQWRLELENKSGPPPFLGVTDVHELAGKFVFVADQSTNVFLHTMITSLQPKLAPLSYRAQSKLASLDPARNPHASGVIRAKYSAPKGASQLEIRFRNVARGNAYCIIYSPNSVPTITCEEGGDKILDGKAAIRHDTAKGDDLPYGVEFGVTTVEDIAGINIFIMDPFGAVHLAGTIPGPK